MKETFSYKLVYTDEHIIGWSVFVLFYLDTELSCNITSENAKLL